MLPKLDGSRGGGPRTTRITQRQLRRDKRAAHQISHSCTQHHGHAPRPDTLWHHNAHGRPKGQWPSVLCTLAYPLGLGGTMGAASLWAWPKNDSLGNMALNWFRAWSTMGCGDKCAGASADAVHPRWIARLGGEEQHGPQQCQRRRDKRAAPHISHRRTQHHGHAPRPDTLWHHSDQGRQWPSELCTLAYPWAFKGQRARPVFGHGQK